METLTVVVCVENAMCCSPPATRGGNPIGSYANAWHADIFQMMQLPVLVRVDCELQAQRVGPIQFASSARPGDKTSIELDVRFPKLETVQLYSTDGYHPFLDVWETSAFFRAAGRAGLLEVSTYELHVQPVEDGGVLSVDPEAS
jgi:hypothetical protein